MQQVNFQFVYNFNLITSISWNLELLQFGFEGFHCIKCRKYNLNLQNLSPSLLHIWLVFQYNQGNSQPSSPARTPRVYASVAEMKRSKGKVATS